MTTPDADPLRPVRGILYGLAYVTPFWLAVAFLLLR